MADKEGVVYKVNTMREFERLRKQSSSSCENRLHWTKDAELLELEQEYHRLLKRKEELSRNVKEMSILNQLQHYIDEQAEGNFAPLGELATEDNLFKAIKLIKKRKLIETYNIYRLTGLTFVLLDDNCVRFCLDTFFKGQYFEPFYMEIQVENEKLKIRKHTIPFFIPLEEIRQKYEYSSDIKELLSIVSAYLKAFVSRRQQCVQLRETSEDYSVQDFYATLAFDFVKFTLKFSSEDTPNIIVKMKYSDLNDTLPKEVDLKFSDEGDQEMLTELQANFLCLEAKEAVLESRILN